MRLASLLIGAIALAACERRAPPAPVEEAPRPAPPAAPTAAAPPPGQAETAPLRIENLRVVLRTEASFAAAGSSGTDVVRRPWTGPIDQTLAEDGPEPTFLRRKRIEGATDLDGLFARGISNLRKACPQPVRQASVEGRSHVQIARFPDNYSSARLLLPELWEKIAAEGHGHLTVAVPARDILLWTTSTAKDDQAGIRGQARTAYQSRSFPISPAILRWTGRGWKVEDPNPVP
jgi:hypothetical protein